MSQFRRKRCVKREVMKEEEDRLAREQRLRKAVYNAIIALSECVVETTLQKMLNSLDQNSWMEVIEERYLGRMCGFPLCANPVEVKNSQKYRIDLKNKKVFERSAEIDKFCCQECFLRSASVRTQLDTEPLWIRGDKQVKVFDLNAENTRQQQQDICGRNTFEFNEDQQLVTLLEILKIGDSAESDNEDNDDKISTDEEKKDQAHEEFYNLCWSCLTMRPAVSNTEETIFVPTVKGIVEETVTEKEIETVKKHKQLSQNEKLARIRNKYHPNKLRRPPKIIEAKSLSSQLSHKVPENFYESFKRTLSEWCGPETISYLLYRRRMDLSDGEDEVVTEARSITARFYAGDRFINKRIERDIFLPPIDNVDQTKQRIWILTELLKPSWRLLEERLSINGYGQQALEIVSTFQLSAANVVLERKTCDLAVVVIFRLLAYYDRSLMDFYPSGSAVSSKMMQYFEQIGCDVKCYFEILSTVMNKLE
uniref:RNA polymerase II subunit B1 CTD phosphatase RPAP2 homolog n=2 Tax=Wuchereria bancrofti TaxID=6293 RepID=A0AAF5PL09_WUCBA